MPTGGIPLVNPDYITVPHWCVGSCTHHGYRETDTQNERHHISYSCDSP